MTCRTIATPHPIRRIASATALALVLATPLALAPVLTPPAHAFFGGFGRIVYDPTNHAENLLTAARTLEQINNQIASLQNEAQMLINQARNLASLPHSSLQQLQQNVSRTQQLLDEAQSIAFEVQEVDQAFERRQRNRGNRRRARLLRAAGAAAARQRLRCAVPRSQT